MKRIFIVLTMCLLVVSGCSSKGSSDVKDVKLTDLMSEIKDNADFDLPSFMDIDEATMESVYGLKAADVEQFAIAFPMMNTQATEIIMIEAKEGKLDTVKKALDTRMKTVEETWATYLPAQKELVDHRKTIEKGNYVIIVIAEKADDIAKTIEAKF